MTKEPIVIAKIYDLILWTIPHLDKFPRNHKFTIGDRIETLLLDILELLLESAYSREKSGSLSKANIKLEKLRFLMRLSNDLQLLSQKQYFFAINSIEEIGKQIGGWRKSENS